MTTRQHFSGCGGRTHHIKFHRKTIPAPFASGRDFFQIYLDFLRILHDGKLPGGIQVAGQHAQVGIIIGELVLLFHFHQTGGHQLLHMLADGSLRVIKMLHQILVADGDHGLVGLHDVAENFHSRRVCQRVGHIGNEQNLFFRHVFGCHIGFFS